MSDIFYPHTGGIPEHILYLCKTIRQLGHDARILAPSYGKNHPWVEDYIIRLGRAVKIPKNRSFAVLTFGVLIPWKLRRLLERERFDVIHLHGSIAPTLPYLALKYSKAKNFITFHSAHEKSYGYVLWEPVLEQYFRKLDGLIAVSTVARDSVAKYFPGRYRIIPNGIDTERFNPDVRPIEELSGYSPKVLFVGRFEPRKGLKYLLQSFPMVLREIPTARLVVVGQGILERYYRRYVEEHIKGSVHFVGHVSAQDLPRYYASCDVYCSPATGAESFGIVLLEAMAAETPIVCSDIPGYRTIMEDGREGLFFTACDPKALAQKLVQLLKDPARRKEMGANGRKKAIAYDWKKVTNQVLDFYHEALNNAQG
ncbi:glycosyltransferase family 4 protein [candidate division WOR-3 bacterium]|nr:glycosyltransferase family 4 protein [candidate division WOR-3 bacterium]